MHRSFRGLPPARSTSPSREGRTPARLPTPIRSYHQLMNSRTDEALRRLDEQHEILRRAVDSVPPERRELKPAPDRWSVAEILEHIAIVERRLEKLFASRIAEASASGRDIDQASLPDLHPWDWRRTLDRSRRVIAGEAVRPTGTLDFDSAWAAAEQSYASFCRTVAASDGIPLGQMIYPHPVFGPMNLYGWVDFVAGHEGRHALQIEELGSLAG